MSTRGVAVPYASEGGDRTRLGQLWELLQRYSPSQGWATLLLLLAALFIVGDSVLAADWVDAPGLQMTLALSAFTGLLLSKARLPWFLLLVVGLVVGFIVVVWQTSSLIEGEPLAEQVRVLWNRLATWWGAARGGGISNDLLPFTLVVLSAGWIIGFFASWFIFRRNNVWVGVVLMATAILTNLSFLPERFGSRFFLFMFFALLLVVRMTVINNHEQWRRTGVSFSPVGGWLTMHAAVWISVVVLLVAAWLPMNAIVSRPLADLWKTARSPVERVEDDFARLFSGIPSRKNTAGRLFGKTLPFIGKISFDGEVVFLADTPYPSYWLSRTYSEYTSQGWKAGEASPIEVGPELPTPGRSDSFKRQRIDQTVQLSFNSTDFLAGGSLDWISREGEVGALAPKTFVVDLYDPSGDAALPEELREAAVQLREVLDNPNPETQFTESLIYRFLPEDLVPVNFVYSNNPVDNFERLVRVHIERKAPTTPDIISYSFNEELEENSLYAISSFVSLATDDDLRNAGTDYSGFVRDHYLQLPATLPQRVRDLALELTSNAETPLDKALAIQDYLREDGGFVYSQDIEAPPPTADGVDWFLFESRTGYSDYFGSSMTVLLRAAGVPARMAAGYAPGEFDEEVQRRVVRDFDSHGWVQAYFPNFGWIDFEPTPRWPVHQRSLLSGPGAEDVPDRLSSQTGADDPADAFDPSIERLGEGEEVFDPLTDGGFERTATSIAIPALIALGAVAGVWILGQTLWTMSLANASPVERAYAKMSRLGAMAGIGRRAQQTPAEYAAALGKAVPDISQSAQRIAAAFTGSRYGRRDADESQQQELEKAWRSMRGSLLARAIRRFIPISGV
ncbi:MAG: transglutaminase domain-containing protein [Chloroflexi bacterium]|nr:transglutaminase domain-containing protein [Chloroflexota bacterium]